MRTLLALITVLVLWTGKLVPGAGRLPGGVEAALAGYVGLQFLWIVVLARSSAADLVSDFGPWRPRSLAVGLVVALVLFVATGIGYVVSERVLNLSPPAEAGLAAHGIRPRSLLLIGMVIGAAILEEWVFRGVLLEVLDGHRAWITVVASAAIFAAYHLSLYQLLPTFVLGAGLAILVLHLGVLWPAVIAHASFNAMGLLLFTLGGATGPGSS